MIHQILHAFMQLCLYFNIPDLIKVDIPLFLMYRPRVKQIRAGLLKMDFGHFQNAN